MKTQGTTLEKGFAVDARMQRHEDNHVSDGSELIPSEVAAKGLPEREAPLEAIQSLPPWFRFSG